jgi:hypothetical protein
MKQIQEFKASKSLPVIRKCVSDTYLAPKSAWSPTKATSSMGTRNSYKTRQLKCHWAEHRPSETQKITKMSPIN